MIQNIHEPAISPSKLDGTMTTLSGIKFDLMCPSPEMVDILDIATGLSNQGHFNGQSPKMFSIAQHCIMVFFEYKMQNPEATDEMKLLALLHDASEAYTGDIIKPLKIYLPNFVNIENAIMQAIALRFRLPIERMAEIKSYDLLVQNIEYNAFYRGTEITYFKPADSRAIFLNLFEQYYHGK